MVRFPLYRIIWTVFALALLDQNTALARNQHGQGGVSRDSGGAVARPLATESVSRGPAVLDEKTERADYDQLKELAKALDQLASVPANETVNGEKAQSPLQSVFPFREPNTLY